MMTRSNFKSLADAIRHYNRTCFPGDEFSNNQVEALSNWCITQNDSFNPKRWFAFIERCCNEQETHGSYIPEAHSQARAEENSPSTGFRKAASTLQEISRGTVSIDKVEARKKQ